MKPIHTRLLVLIAGGIVAVTSCKKSSSTTSLSPVTAADPCVTGTGASNIISGKYIIAFSNGTVGRQASDASLVNTGAALLERNAVMKSKLKAVFPGEPGGFIAELSVAEAAKLATDPSVKLIEPDRVIVLGGCFTVAEPRLITWNIRRVGYADGTGKTAWIIDSGIDMDHPDLNVDGSRSRSFISGLSSPDDDNGHGTHVAGIIAGKNNTFGVLGVASGATVVSLRVMGADGTGTLSSIIQALAYLNTNAAAGDVANMSLGVDVKSEILNQQVQASANRGVYFAIAAGNDAKAANLYSPASANGSNIYTVSAIDSLDRFASFSNFGNDVVDYAVPGVNILSTYSQGRYAYMSGTSMAAPHMAGLLLLKGRNITVSGAAKNDPDGTADLIAHY